MAWIISPVDVRAPPQFLGLYVVYKTTWFGLWQKRMFVGTRTECEMIVEYMLWLKKQKPAEAGLAESGHCD